MTSMSGPCLIWQISCILTHTFISDVHVHEVRVAHKKKWGSFRIIQDIMYIHIWYCATICTIALTVEWTNAPQKKQNFYWVIFIYMQSLHQKTKKRLLICHTTVDLFSKTADVKEKVTHLKTSDSLFPNIFLIPSPFSLLLPIPVHIFFPLRFFLSVLYDPHLGRFTLITVKHHPSEVILQNAFPNLTSFSSPISLCKESSLIVHLFSI